MTEVRSPGARLFSLYAGKFGFICPGLQPSEIYCSSLATINSPVPFFEGVAEYEMRTIKGSIYRTKQRKQTPAEERRLVTNLCLMGFFTCGLLHVACFRTRLGINLRTFPFNSSNHPNLNVDFIGLKHHNQSLV